MPRSKFYALTDAAKEAKQRIEQVFGDHTANRIPSSNTKDSDAAARKAALALGLELADYISVEERVNGLELSADGIASTRRDLGKRPLASMKDPEKSDGGQGARGGQGGKTQPAGSDKMDRDFLKGGILTKNTIRP